MKKYLFLLLAVTGMSALLSSQVTPGSIVIEPIDPFLATPAMNHVKTIPVDTKS